MIGRSKEKEMLLTCEEPKEAEFVVLYGRRRVGKTYLINSLFDNRFTFRFTGIENGNTELTINAFRLALENYGAVNLSEKKEWLYCFNDLRKLIEQSPQKGKKIVFLDELPWMDTANSDFLPAFEHFWNGWASSRKDLMLIVCGSVTSWIIRKLFRNVGGLFNRVTRQIRLQAFSLRECREYFLDQGFNYSQREVIESYMIFGGIPYYLSLFRKSYSFKGNIDQICFGNNPALRDEMEHLLATLSSSSKTYLEVIFCMKKKQAGISREELLQQLKITDGGYLSEILEDLENCDFIRKYTPIHSKKKGSLYQLYDSFLLFYLEFIQEQGRTEGFWSSYAQSPAHSAWSGYAFEIVCLHHLEQIRFKLGISGVITNPCSWRSTQKKGGAQIDLILDRNDNIVNLIEMKYIKEEYSISDAYAKQLENRIAMFMHETKTKKTPHLTFITVNGLYRNQNYNLVSSEILADDLFKL